MIIIKNKCNNFEDMLGSVIETEDKFLNKKLNSHICYGKGGGGRQQQQDIAPTLRPYVTDVLSRAKGQVDAPYQAYPGERVVGFTPQELAAQEGIQQMAGQYGLASMAPGLTSSAAYYNPAYSYLGQTGETLATGAGALAESGGIQRGAARAIGRDEVGRFGLTGEDIQKYMDPYQQAVTDIEKRQAQQDALQTAQAIAAKSAGAGAFGGSRQAILESQAASDLGTRLADIQARGQQRAYQQALQTAAQQQQVGLGEAAAQRAREQQLGAGIAGLAGQYGQLAGGLGSLSGQYGSLGQQALGQGYRELGYLSGVGETQRGLGQQRADIAFGEFQQQRDYPMRQLERYAGMAFGVPSGYLQQQQAQPSTLQQLAGAGLTAVGLGRGLDFFKEGGDIGKGGGLSTVYRQSGSLVSPKLYREGARMVPITELSNQSLIPMFGVDAEKEKERRGLKAFTVSGTQFGKAKGRDYKREEEKEKKEEEVKPEVTSETKPEVREGSVDKLEKAIEALGTFDKEAAEKQAKLAQGLGMAELGFQLMTRPAAEVQTAAPIAKVVAAQKELKDIPRQEAKAYVDSLTAKLGIKQLEKDLLGGGLDYTLRARLVDDLVTNSGLENKAQTEALVRAAEDEARMAGYTDENEIADFILRTVRANQNILSQDNTGVLAGQQFKKVKGLAD
jgi:hypothetical protein